MNNGIKKTLFILILSLYPLIASDSDNALGLQFGYPDNIALTFKHNHFPVATLSYTFGDTTYIGATVDYWIVNNPIAKAPLSWYMGAGGFIRIFFNGSNDEDSFDLGARLPVGLQWFPAQQVEVYGEAAPGASLVPGLKFAPAIGIGIRYHFK